MDARQSARFLNAHHMQHCAGFYPSTGGRAFLARMRKGILEISYDFKAFFPVQSGTVFRDHNGRAIATYKA